MCHRRDGDSNGRTWAARCTICASVISRHRLDQILKSLLIPQLGALAHSGRHFLGRAATKELR